MAEPTIGSARRDAVARLRAAGVDSPSLDARLLLEAATGRDATRQLAEASRELTRDECHRLEVLLARRLRREPIAYILGRREFHGLEFEVGPEVLVPRPDTETLVDRALALIPIAGPSRILDLGTGSGCILLTLLAKRPQATGVGTDTSEAALDVARRNARRLAVVERSRLVRTSWALGVRGPFDLVVSNPPYIGSADLLDLPPEVGRYEPRLALDGGPDGLEAYRALTSDLCRCLGLGGTALLEIGPGQEGPLSARFQERGLDVARHSDLGGRARVLELRRRTASRPPSTLLSPSAPDWPEPAA